MPNDVFIPDEHLEGFTERERALLKGHIDADSETDLTKRKEGRELLRRFKQSRDAADPKPPRIPEPGELPPMHLQGEELENWLERQRTQSLLEGEE